jgi:hypothetical protein
MLLPLILLPACCSRPLSVFSTYVTPEELASYYVGAPDPALKCPQVGMRIHIDWNIAKDFSLMPLELRLSIHFRNRTETIHSVAVNTFQGSYVYSILNADYFDRNGVLAYKVELLANGTAIEQWKHQLWVDFITFPQEPEEPAEE